MNQPNQGNDPNAPPSIPVKRKRGRPRKDKSLNRVVTVHVPPGFQGVIGNQPRQADPIDEGNDGMVGQAVTGVVEAAFDAGYLLTVKIGSSNTYLRGVVFKPGHYVPISAQNDVAPQVQMVRRNDTHLPAENPIRERGHSQRSRERNKPYLNISGNDTSLVLNGSHRGSRIKPRKSKTVPSVLAPSVPLVGSRGTVVPVILQPVALSNGLPQATHVGPAKDVQVQKVASQTVHGQSQPNQASPKSGQNENSTFHLGSPEVKITGLPVQDPHSLDAHLNNGAPGSKLSAEDSDHANVNEPLVIEPLQAIRSDVNRTAATPKVLESNRAGRMTELLQETMAENREQRVENPHTDTRLESHEPKSPETSLGDEETDHSNKRSRASSD